MAHHHQGQEAGSGCVGRASTLAKLDPRPSDIFLLHPEPHQVLGPRGGTAQFSSEGGELR